MHDGQWTGFFGALLDFLIFVFKLIYLKLKLQGPMAPCQVCFIYFILSYNNPIENELVFRLFIFLPFCILSYCLFVFLSFFPFCIFVFLSLCHNHGVHIYYHTNFCSNQTIFQFYHTFYHTFYQTNYLKPLPLSPPTPHNVFCT